VQWRTLRNRHLFRASLKAVLIQHKAQDPGVKPTAMSHREQLSFWIEEGCCQGAHWRIQGKSRHGRTGLVVGCLREEPKVWKRRGLGDLGRKK